MANHVMHFAIHADDLDRARKFYASVFGWTFQPWGAPDMKEFCQVQDAEGGAPGILGAMQSRRFNVAGKDVFGYECTIQVDDLDATAAAVVAAGGKVVMPKTPIPTVGTLIKFLDSEGNLVCAIRLKEPKK